MTTAPSRSCPRAVGISSRPSCRLSNPVSDQGYAADRCEIDNDEWALGDSFQTLNHLISSKGCHLVRWWRPTIQRHLAEQHAQFKTLCETHLQCAMVNEAHAETRAEGRDMRITEDLHIECAPATAFDLMADVRNETQWNDDVSRAELTTD